VSLACFPGTVTVPIGTAVSPLGGEPSTSSRCSSTCRGGTFVERRDGAGLSNDVTVLVRREAASASSTRSG